LKYDKVERILNEKDDVEDFLRLGKFRINKPSEYDSENVLLEINDYDYDSTTISIDELKLLHDYIGQILKYK
jgi:hypothetical protein